MEFTRRDPATAAIVNMASLAGFGWPKEVAPVVAFLLEDEASRINGVNIPVDGGMESVIYGDIFEPTDQ